MSNSSTHPAAGAELALLLLLGFRTLVDALHERLAAAGHPEARPMHGFVLQAIGPDGATTVQLGHRLGVSKQAAGKLVGSLEQLGYVRRAADAADARRRPATWTPRGRDMLARSAGIFDELRAEWADRIGSDRLDELQADLAAVTAGSTARLLDTPGWFGAR